jgi:iron complex outermembrane receptor protein
VFVTVGGMVEDREGGTVSGGTSPAGTPFRENLETRRLDGGLVGSWLLSGTRRLSVRGSAMVQRHRHSFGTALERDVHATEFGEVALSGQDGDHAWVLGAALQHERYDGRDVPAFDFGYTTPAVFVQDEYTPVRSVILSASARLDRHSEYGTFVNPRVSALFRPGEWVMRASVGTGYFAPSPFTEETEAVGLGRLIPFGELEAERALGAMVDIGRSFGPWEVNATLFGSKVEDALVVSPDGSGSLMLANSTEPVRTWGSELLARYHSGPIHATATHVYTRSTEADPDATGRREVPLTPRHTIGLVGAWETEGTGRIGMEVYYTGRQSLDDNPYRRESKPYWILGFLVERRFGPARFFINLENVLDTRQTKHDRLVLPSRSLEGEWITSVWSPLDGRAVNGGARLAF